jgi:ppGpp synthetase/RelA/SpoT-type nucleotidyltranferase
VDIEQARADWIKVRPQYREFADLLNGRLSGIAQELGIYGEVSAREKEVHSLVKKLIRKPHLTYETLPDKVGARVVVRYRSELDRVERLVKERFRFASVEDKADALGLDRVGYLSIHLDGVGLKEQDPAIAQFPSDRFFGEIQIRTFAQHLWSEVSHDAFYKNDDMVNKLPADLQRRVHLAAGLVEVADREFDRMYEEARPTQAVEVFRELEKLYYSVASRRPDVELSLEVIDHVLPLYGGLSAKDILGQHVVPAFDAHREELAAIYANPDNDYEHASAFFFQPEAILLYERLGHDRDQLMLKWNDRFPERELIRVAENFGYSFE